MVMQSLVLQLATCGETLREPSHNLSTFSACPNAAGDAGTHSGVMVGLNRLGWKFSIMQGRAWVEKWCQLQIIFSASYADLTLLIQFPK